MSDYSEHLIAARKALLSAEEFAALHKWDWAAVCVTCASAALEGCQHDLMRLELEEAKRVPVRL